MCIPYLNDSDIFTMQHKMLLLDVVAKTDIILSPLHYDEN